jgi:hypothetical protein
MDIHYLFHILNFEFSHKKLLFFNQQKKTFILGQILVAIVVFAHIVYPKS